MNTNQYVAAFLANNAIAKSFVEAICRQMCERINVNPDADVSVPIDQVVPAWTLFEREVTIHVAISDAKTWAFQVNKADPSPVKPKFAEVLDKAHCPDTEGVRGMLYRKMSGAYADSFWIHCGAVSNMDGAVRWVMESQIIPGLLHIFSPDQLESTGVWIESREKGGQRIEPK